MKGLIKCKRVDVQRRTNVAGGMTPVATKDKGSEIYLKS